MVIETNKGYFEILKNVRGAFNVEQFESYYIEEMYDKYAFLVIDIADDKPRIKGFNKDNQSNDYFHYILDYVGESCNYLAPYAILRRINEKEYLEHKDDKINDEITKPFGYVSPIEKENFDKENLSFEHTLPDEKNIDLSRDNFSTIELYPLPDDIKNEIIKEKQNELRNHSKKKFKNNNNNQNNKKEKVFTHKNSN